MKTIEILLEQETIMTVRQLADKFSHDEWYNIANNLLKQRLEQTTSAATRENIRTTFLEQLGKTVAGTYSPASNPGDWQSRASRYGIWLEQNDPTWNDIYELLQQHTGVANLSGTEPEEPQNTNPYRQNRQEILALYANDAPTRYNDTQLLKTHLTDWFWAHGELKERSHPGYQVIYENANNDPWKTAHHKATTWTQQVGGLGVTLREIQSWLVGFAEMCDRTILPLLDRQD